MYKYHLPTAFGSDKLLIEILEVSDGETFFADFLKAIESIKPVISNMAYLSMADEIGWNMTSDAGEFTLSTDDYKTAFVTAAHNQPALEKIDEILQQSIKFEKQAIDNGR